MAMVQVEDQVRSSSASEGEWKGDRGLRMSIDSSIFEGPGTWYLREVVLMQPEPHECDPR